MPFDPMQATDIDVDPDVAARPSMSDAERDNARIARTVARIAQSSGIGSDVAWAAFNAGGMPELRRVAANARADAGIARQNNVTTNAQMRNNPMLLLNNPNINDWQRYVVAEAMLGQGGEMEVAVNPRTGARSFRQVFGGKRGMGPNELAAASAPDAQMQALQVRIDEGAANRDLEMERLRQDADQRAAAQKQALDIFQSDQALKLQELEARLHQQELDRKAKMEADEAARAFAAEQNQLDREAKAKPAEDDRLTDLRVRAAEQQLRTDNPVEAGTADLLAGKLTREALKEAERVAELYDSGSETSPMAWWSFGSGLGGFSDDDEANLRDHFIGLGVDPGVAAAAARHGADTRRWMSQKRGMLPPGAARPRE